MAETPTVRCPRKDCNHPIDSHLSPRTAEGHLDPHRGCLECDCKVTPNTIAVANVHQVLFGDLTQTDPGLTSVSRQPDGSWA